MKYPDIPAGVAEASRGDFHSENTRLGLALFLVYLQEYVGFTLLCAFDKEAMSQPSIGGMNFAVVCGFGLIIQAFVLALVYLFFCKPEPAAAPDLTEGALAEESLKEEGSA